MHRALATGVFLALRLASGAMAQVSVDLDVQPRIVQVGEVAVCSITIRGLDNPPTPALPNLSGFTVSSVGTERSFSMGPGGRDSSTTFRFQLLPLQTGEFTIGPFQYELNGQTFTLPSVPLRVTAAGDRQGTGGGAQEWSELLFATLTASASNVFVQQPFDLDIAVYSRGINLGRDIGLDNLPTTGLDIQPFQEIQSSREIVNNQVYDVRRFRAKAQALTAGQFRFEPSLRVQVLVQRERRRSAEPFGMFDDGFFPDAFFGRVQAHPVQLSIPAIDLTIRPPPAEGRPPGYAGAVGRFAFDVQARPAELQAGEPVTLTIQISGEGNLGNITPPTLAAGPDLRVYEPRLVTRDLSTARAAGRLLYEQVVIPRSEKTRELPALTFSYLDPTSGRYESITRGPFALNVRPAPHGAARVVAAPQDGTPDAAPLVLGTDIVYLKPLPARWHRAAPSNGLSARLFMALQIAPALAVLAVFLAVRRREHMDRDVAWARRRRAPRSARPGLQRAERALAAGDRTGLADSLWQAATAYFGNRFNLPPGAITRDIMTERLRNARLDPEQVRRLEDVLAFCDQQRFGRLDSEGMTPEDRAQIERLREVLKACERIRV